MGPHKSFIQLGSWAHHEILEKNKKILMNDLIVDPPLDFEFIYFFILNNLVVDQHQILKNVSFG